MRQVAIAGVGIVKFGRYDGQKGRPFKSVEELGREAILNVLKDADMEWKDVQAAFCGNVYAGMASGHRSMGLVGMTGIPIVNVEDACSSSTAALRLAYQQVAFGLYDVVLVLGVEKVPPGLLDDTSTPEWQRYLGINVFPAWYAMDAVRYMVNYGATEEDFARMAVLERNNATNNPNAMFCGQKTSVEEVLAGRYVAKPLRFLMCCANADGATAVILASRNKLKRKDKVITIAASVHTTGSYGTHPPGGGSVKIKNLNCVEISAHQVWETSGYGPEDMDIIQAYGAMSSGVMIATEELGFCKRGEFPRLLKEGVFNINGRIPLNTDGGLVGRGHPLGATGLAQIVELTTQLRGAAGPRQVPNDPKMALSHTEGAGPNSVITILKR
ncbi:MAG: thiolase family protein [Chloroflexi bacterium]|nr:thiolase family protein [Chloroflexota bacterium]